MLAAPQPAVIATRPAKAPLTIMDRISGSRCAFHEVCSQWSRPKAKLDKLSGVTDWRLHDLRRTLVTGMNEALNIEPHVIEAVVNHQSGTAKAGVAGTYNRAQYMKQRRVALESWAQHIMGIVSGAAESNVVSLR